MPALLAPPVIETLRPDQDPRRLQEAAWLILSEVYPGAPDLGIQMRAMRSRLTLVALDVDERILGTAALLHPEPVAENIVMDVATSPDSRGRGIGKRVMEELIERAKEAGTRKLWIHSPGPTAVGFYTEKLEFQQLPDDKLVRTL